MRSGNPALNDKTFNDFAGASVTADNQMTLQGTVTKTFVLLLLTMATAGWMFFEFRTAREPAQLEALYPWLMGGAIGGFIVAMATFFLPKWASITGPLYALLEGLVLGGVSAIFEAEFPGIAFQAMGLTFGTLFMLLAAYTSGLIKVTQNFRLGVIAATGGIFLIYLTTFVLSFFGVNVPYIHESGLIGIGFSIFVVIIAALNLVLDFDYIESGVARGAPKYMEWYSAFSLMVTLIWLYLEILRLLAKIRSRD